MSSGPFAFRSKVLGWVGALAVLLWGPSLFAQGEATPRARFEKNVLPILRQSCFACHVPGTTSPLSDLKLKNKARREQIKAQADFEMGEKFPFPNGYSAKKQLARSEKELKEGRMPPKTRETFHLGAPLSDKDRKALLDWIDSQKKRVR